MNSAEILNVAAFRIKSGFSSCKSTVLGQGMMIWRAKCCNVSAAVQMNRFVSSFSCHVNVTELVH